MSDEAHPPVASLAPELPVSTPWGYVTRRFRLLAHDFAIRTNHAGLARYLDEVFAPAAVPGAPTTPTTWYSIVTGLPGERADALLIDEDRVLHTDQPHYILKHLMWHINQQAIRKSLSTHVLVHAAVAARDGVGIVMPAPQEAGKTTLVAGLVSAGFGYLSDEAAAIHPESLEIAPFPKPLSVDKGSWEVLAGAEPQLDETTRQYVTKQWQASPLSLRHGSVSGPVPAGLLILPTYRAGAATTLEPVRAVDALVATLSQTFYFHRAAQRNLEVLARLLATVHCYRLTVGDLAVACEAVDGACRRHGRS